MLIIGMIDDEQTSLEMAKGAFKAFFNASKVDVDIKAFSSPRIFLDSLNDTNYDLICSDIIMQEMDGIQLATEIRRINKTVPLIFISSNETNVFSCFSFNPIGFIRKTNFFIDTQNTMKHFIDDVYPNRRITHNLEVKSHGETRIISIDKLMYIEGNHNYQAFHILDEKEPIEVRKLISDLEQELSPYGFIRVHKGFLVNYNYIFKFTNDHVILKNDVKIPLSRQSKDSTIKKYMDLTKETMQGQN